MDNRFTKSPKPAPNKLRGIVTRLNAAYFNPLKRNNRNEEDQNKLTNKTFPLAHVLDHLRPFAAVGYGKPRGRASAFICFSNPSSTSPE